MMLKFNIGCSGFYNKHWQGVFYPEKLPQNQWLNFYSEQLNTVEINSTFYRFPTAKTLDTWYQKTHEDFKFSMKVPKQITHIQKFNDCQQAIDDFYAACQQGLKDKLGCILFQLPPSIVFSDEKLLQITDSLNPNFKNVIEFRHISWWTQRVYDVLQDKKIVFCSVSHPTLPPTILTNMETTYVRLHGTPDMFYSNYSTEQLQELHDTLVKQPNLKEAYIYFNNTASTAGILNAQQLAAL
jgi:uncharacterized protein YecE (DUF72 family)